MKKESLFIILIIILAILSLVLFTNKDQVTLQPWVSEYPLEWIGHASGNGEAIAVVLDAARTVVVTDNSGKVLYQVKAGMNPARSLVSAEFVELDSENNLYVYDKIFAAANQENTERVLKYSNKGKFIGIVYEYTYKNEDFITTKGKISGIAVHEDELYVARLEKDLFFLDIVDTIADAKGDYEIIEKVSFWYPNAFRDLLFCRLNVNTNRLVWTTKSGSILEYDFAGIFKSKITAGDEGLAYMAALDDNNNIITNNLWSANIGFINRKTQSQNILFHRPLTEGLFYNYLSNVNNGTAYASYLTNEVLIINGDGTTDVLDSYYYSDNLLTIRYILFGVVISALLDLAVILVLTVMFLAKIKTSSLFKQIMMVGLCVLFGASISSLIILNEMGKRNTENTYNELENICRIIGVSINKDIIKDIDSPALFDSDEYHDFSMQVKSIISELRLEGKLFYFMIWKDCNGISKSVYDLENSVGSYYPWGEFEGSLFAEVYESKEYVRYSDFLPSGRWEMVVAPIFDNNGKVIAVIDSGINLKVIEEENKVMIIQTALIVLATTAAFLLLVIECLLMFDAHLKNKKRFAGSAVTGIKPNMLKYIIALLMGAYKKEIASSETPEVSPQLAGSLIRQLIETYKSNIDKAFHPELIRAAAFFMYFAANFATALLPIHAVNLYVPFLNLPREFVVTLPFISTVIFSLFSLFLVPLLLKITGIRKICLVSGILFVAGNVTCILAENVIHLSIGYGLLGLTVGAFSLVFNTIIGSQENSADRSVGFAHLNASYLAGVNVGVVFGAMIAQFFPYRTVFWFASGISLLFFAIIVYSMRSILFAHIYDIKYTKEKETAEKFSFAAFLFKPVVLCLLFMAFMPYMVSVNFIEYFMPIFGTENGLGEANIGQLMLLSGLFAILFGASLCKFVAKNIPVLVSVVLPLFMVAAALFIFSINVSVPMLIVSIVILSVTSIFALTNIQTYYSLLYQMNSVPSVKALGALSVVEYIAMAIGPVVFSYILANNISFGMKAMSAAIFVCALIFTVVSKAQVNWNNKKADQIQIME